MRDLTASAADGAVLSATVHDGDGPRVALAHSLALDRHVWDAVIERLPGFSVLAYDCRGHGASERRPGPYTTDQFADDLAAVLDAAGWDRATVAGCSMGGCVAIAFAARHPDRTAGGVFIDTTAWYGPDAPKTWRERAATARKDGLESMAAFQATRWCGDAFRAEHPDVIERALAVFTANDLDCYAAACELLGDADLRGELAKISGPARVIVGEEDYATPPPMAHALAAGLGCAEPEILAGARHLTPLERSEEVAAAIREVARV